VPVKECGEKIGRGAWRDVYIYKPDPSYVVKVPHEKRGRDIAEAELRNKQEYRWCVELNKMGLGHHIAQCRPDGRNLIMQRAKPIPETQAVKVPLLFGDIHRGNFGTIDGSVVCVDYSCVDQLVLRNWGEKKVYVVIPATTDKWKLTRARREKIKMKHYGRTQKQGTFEE
jgi:hypothetical protein